MINRDDKWHSDSIIRFQASLRTLRGSFRATYLDIPILECNALHLGSRLKSFRNHLLLPMHSSSRRFHKILSKASVIIRGSSKFVFFWKVFWSPVVPSWTKKKNWGCQMFTRIRRYAPVIITLRRHTRRVWLYMLNTTQQRSTVDTQ